MKSFKPHVESIIADHHNKYTCSGIIQISFWNIHNIMMDGNYYINSLLDIIVEKGKS